MTAPEQLSVQISGMSFGALAWGDPGAPLALMVHGYPDTAWTWRHLGPFLAQRGWRAVAPFTRGYGPTDLAPNDRYLLADLVDDILALHTALGGDERAVLIGHDWGAAATWALTAAEPTRFSRYVAMSIPPPMTLLKPYTSLRTLGIAARQARMSAYFIANQLPGAEGRLDRVIPRTWARWSPGYDAREDVAAVFAALDSPQRRRAAMRYYRNNLQRGLMATFTVRAGAAALYLHGRDDGCMQSALVDLAGDTLVPGTRCEVVAEAGHFLHLERPDHVNDLIADWVGAPV